MSDVLVRRLSSSDAGFEADLAALLRFDTDDDSQVDQAAAAILRDVRTRGDAALVELTRRFDRVDVTDAKDLEVSRDELRAAVGSLDAAQRDALEAAAARIRRFHERQLGESWTIADDDGTTIGQRVTPLDRVGLYVPGGLAAYPSSVLMNAIPAKVAGVAEVIMVTPTPGGTRNPMVLAAASIAGVDRVFTIGGAQAIGALAYGTATVPAVDKIVGPGNAYVASAKRRVFGTVGIDMIAGPSEILVVADGTAAPDWVAMDLCSQAEHDEVAQAILLCPDAAYIDAVAASLARLVPALPRAAIVTASMRDRCALIHVRDLAEACAIVNRIAPEHLELSVADPQALLPLIRHAGAIFMGIHSSEALGDYCAGPNHVLPTARTARFSSPLGVYDFQKRSSLIAVTPAGARTLGGLATTLARGEGLEAHALGRVPDADVSATFIERVIRDDVRAMHAYAVPDATGFVKLDAMENPFELPADLRDELGARLAAVAVNRYPAPRADALRATLRDVMHVPAGCDVILGNGSDELISLACMAVARDGASVLSLVPGFAMFELSVRFARLAHVAVPLRADFSLDVAATTAALREHRPALAFIAYPNNPTGNCFARGDVEAVIAVARETGTLVIVDEAYNAFAADSFLPDLPHHDNLLVLRTVSKSGLAGARLGYLCGAPAWLVELDKIRPPYNINVFTQVAVRFALEHADVLDGQAAVLREERARLMAALAALEGVTPFPSQANFILFRIESADAGAAARVFDGLKRRGVLIKDLSKMHPLCANALRVTVSRPDENARFLDALGASLHEVLGPQVS